MDSRRRYKGGGFSDQRVQRRTSHNKKPPQRIWRPTVPLWEKQFCYEVGSIPWNIFLETKKYIYIYENVVNWNDTACEEAFHNAKNRYIAKINGLHCDMPLPDPDIYIDNIDWNSEVDPQLILDLERGPEEEVGYSESGVIVNMYTLLGESFGCTGWGDESDFPKEPVLVPATGYGCGTQNAVGDYKNSWEENYSLYNENKKDDRWGDEWNFRKDTCSIITSGWGDERDTGLVPATGYEGCTQNAVGGWEEHCGPYDGSRKADESDGNMIRRREKEEVGIKQLDILEKENSWVEYGERNQILHVPEDHS